MSRLKMNIQRFRLRDSLKRRDSHGISERKRRRLKRRVYSVIGPNHLWHIDTNHKLIRWHFVICAGIDGVSRLITVLSCADNNKAPKVHDCFMQGTQRYGIPVRVRSDMGMENIKVAEYMGSVRGPHSMLVGKSTHNDEALLDVLIEKHLYVLHHVYIGMINERLNVWRNAWNNHRIRTVKSTPLRLFTAEMLNNAPEEPGYHLNYDQHLTITTEDNDTEDGLGQRPIFEFRNLRLNRECLELLENECPQNWVSDNNGIDVFVKAKQIIDRF
ncbi:uncharacterized protein LOC132718962 [Ruditapes philippinarum]|uniref:uncharacterized protein LOC132718962 n=1 Tax=Ruditapes philippinarum TaxID=129788 RepID=UPI00295BA956|nr:uncharacterized protein LOC132718962 [Ruditapes philippinarum]